MKKSTHIVTIASAGMAVAGLIGFSAPASAATSTLKPSNCGSLSTNTDGTVSPIICPNRHPNAKAWATIKAGTPKLAALGAHPTWKQVKAATCADLTNASNPIVIESYQWLAVRHGWLKADLPGAESFGTRLVNGLCG